MRLYSRLETQKLAFYKQGKFLFNYKSFSDTDIPS